MRLAHRIAMVTGGGTGIGEAIAKVFAREGAKVAITGRRAGCDQRERIHIFNTGTFHWSS